ncbi:sensor histidine kinase [Streptomyces sp. NPDC059696]|uniref:sensor histidine kinase n=1 Tax=Streptomyces sp. NPDC059696 TaxID=3346911 RepID=UPI003692DDE1
MDKPAGHSLDPRPRRRRSRPSRGDPAPLPRPAQADRGAHRGRPRSTGIPAERREDVFQRFHQGPDSPGTGLGLTLVAQQVVLHRGRITVPDRPDGGAGTRFELRLPAVAALGLADRHNRPLKPLTSPRWTSKGVRSASALRYTATIA